MPIAGEFHKAVSEYQAFVDDVNDAFQKERSIESTIVLGDFSAHI